MDENWSVDLSLSFGERRDDTGKMKILMAYEGDEYLGCDCLLSSSGTQCGPRHILRPYYSDPRKELLDLLFVLC